ncbi:MAG: hypothetical protein KDI66_19040 [Xanthomonadales bacterium]|nr:hypothetical protein [Xanthomonadales bacterium]
MTYARSILIPTGSAGTFHCVSRRVRRAFLCGEDRLTGRSFEHRRQWVEDRIHQLADIFGVAVWGYAVMCNHPRSSRGQVLHVVVQTLPQAVARWSVNAVAARWMILFPRQDRLAKDVLRNHTHLSRFGLTRCSNNALTAYAPLHAPAENSIIYFAKGGSRVERY